MSCYKALSSIIRKSETIISIHSVKCIKNSSTKKLYLALIADEASRLEQAIFILHQSTIDYFRGVIDILHIYPITKEFIILQLPKGFSIQWSLYKESYMVIMLEDKQIFPLISQTLELVSTYQRSPFKQGSSTHQWIWHYERGNCPWLKLIHPKILSQFRTRQTVSFRPQHKQVASAFYIKEQLNKRKNEYLEKKCLKLGVLTWNTGATLPDPTLSGLFLCSNEKQELECNDPDIIVVGLQEACELNALNILNESQSKNPWLHFIVSEINSHFKSPAYSLIFTESLVGLMLVILAKNELTDCVTETYSYLLRLGLGGYTGNKGAIAIRMRLNDSTLCFVNAHLAAHSNHTSMRNKQIGKIMNEISFKVNETQIKVEEHDFVFLFGDLNYRINELDSKIIQEKVFSGNIDQVLEFDQLNVEKKNQNILVGFEEGTISFLPTFKLVRGEDAYNAQREPAWCDRVLWKGDAELKIYDRSSIVTQSDHKPVFAFFSITTNLKINEKMEEIKKEICEGMK